MTTRSKAKVVACIPAYNEEKMIAKVLVRASPHVDELVVVDDGSEDDTGAIAEKFGASVIRHNRNLGKGAALRDCFDWARKNDVDILITVDADGQHDPNDIPTLICPVRAGEADIVIGYRLVRPQGMTARRRFAQKTLDAVVGIKDGNALMDSQSGFRAYSRTAISGLTISEWGMGAESEILLQASKLGLKIRQVPVQMTYDVQKTSPRNPIIHFTDIVSSLLKFSLVRRPLRAIGIPGVLLLIVGVYGWLDVFATYNSAQGFALGHALIYSIILLAGIFMTIAALLLFVMRIMLQERG
jgi:glycosyltransferase involved in cell wall biosynthesis